MSLRFAALVSALVIVIAAPLPAQPPTAKAKTWTAPRTPDGHPDLQGIWTNATITPLERPAALAGKATLNDAEAKAYEIKDSQTNTLDESDSPLVANTGSGAVGGYNNLFIDRGNELARVDGVKRTSLIVDPPDGKVPFLTNRPPLMRAPGFGSYDSVKDRPLSERCMLGFGSTSGPPMMPVLYNNNYQIVQTRDAVMILVEMVHDVRIIRMNATAHIRAIFAVAGRFDRPLGRRHAGGRHHQFHRSDPVPRVDRKPARDRALQTHRRPEHILYRATIEDPATYYQAMDPGISVPRDRGPIYEYACHEGNYAMPDILGGARKLETEGKK